MPPTTRTRPRWVQAPTLDAWYDRYGEFPPIMRVDWFRDPVRGVVHKMRLGLDLSSALTHYAFWRRGPLRRR